jgi:signal transduction histidine kinase
VSAPRSLRVRLLAAATMSILLSVGIAGVFIVQNFAATIDRERVSDLGASLKRLAALIDPDSDVPLAPDVLADPRYDTPLSGVYWQVDDVDRGNSYRSRSLWDGELPPVTDTGEPVPRPVAMRGPEGETLIALSQMLSLEASDGNRTFRVTVAESREDPDLLIQRFGIDIAITLGLLSACLIAASWFQVWLGLRPLAKLREDVDLVRQGGASRLTATHPGEVQPLVEAVNNLLARQEESLAFARHRAADLAHGLKTPLSVLSATAERVRAAGDESNAGVIALLCEEMNERVEYQLKLARLRIRTSSEGMASVLNGVVLRTVSVLKKSERGAVVNWGLELGEQITVDVDEHDLMELIGIVLENALKWTKSEIRIACLARDGTAFLDVDDDGTGITDAQIALVGARGVRLDESRPGEGLGLAIAYDVIRLNRGTIKLSRARLGGLRVHIELPLARVGDSAGDVERHG